MSGRSFREVIERIIIFFLGVIVGSGIIVLLFGVGFAFLGRISEQLLQSLAMVFFNSRGASDRTPTYIICCGASDSPHQN
jgi:hypothetical protein